MSSCQIYHLTVTTQGPGPQGVINFAMQINGSSSSRNIVALEMIPWSRSRKLEEEFLIVVIVVESEHVLCHPRHKFLFLQPGKEHLQISQDPFVNATSLAN